MHKGHKIVKLLGMCEDGSSGRGTWGYGLDRAGSGEGQVKGTYDCGNEPYGSIKMQGIS